MKKIFFVSFFILFLPAIVLASGKHNVEIKVLLDPSLSLIPQKIYLRTLMGNEEDIKDSAVIDKNHNIIRLYATIPYQTQLMLVFSETNINAEIIATPGDKLK